MEPTEKREPTRCQIAAKDVIRNVNEKFDAYRWITKCEVPDVNKHTLVALVRSGFLETKEVCGVTYYREIDYSEEET